MRIIIMIFFILLLSISCAKPHKEGEPLTGDDLRLAQKATELSKKVDELSESAPSSLADKWKGFADNVKLFENNCQRHSCDSLEARNDFNHLRYYAVQLDSIVHGEADAKFATAWTAIRKNYVDEIGRELGYRIK
jgi:hypothetical protein